MNYPDVSFIDNLSVETLEENMIRWFKEKRKELTGKDITLGAADDRRLILSTGAYFIYQAFQKTDQAGKMGLLKYATGDFLENLGALKGVTRNPARGATVTLRYSMTSARTSVTPVPAGSRATAGDGVYFSTQEYAEIAAGDTYVDIEATCDTPGTDGNVYAIGEIDKMEAAVPFIDSVTNTTKAQNGRDIESDDDLRERILLAPESYTSAGSKGAYEYYVRTYDSTIEDVSITSPTPREVEIRCILANGELPQTEYINGLTAYLNSPDIKMLTDLISVEAPDTVNYSINMTYYINQSDTASALTIQNAVNNAVSK
jgi:phage-related baseplate assembly protein